MSSSSGEGTSNNIFGGWFQNQQQDATSTSGSERSGFSSSFGSIGTATTSPSPTGVHHKTLASSANGTGNGNGNNDISGTNADGGSSTMNSPTLLWGKKWLMSGTFGTGKDDDDAEKRRNKMQREWSTNNHMNLQSAPSNRRLDG